MYPGYVGEGKAIPTECLPYLPVWVLQRFVGFHGLPSPADVCTTVLLVRKSVARCVLADCEVGSSELGCHALRYQHLRHTRSLRMTFLCSVQ